MNNYSSYYDIYNYDYITNNNKDTRDFEKLYEFDKKQNKIYQDNLPQSAEIYSQNEALTKGNLFPRSYMPYKNYQVVPLKPKDEKDRILQEIQELGFCQLELDLYLDTHPEDHKMINEFSRYQKKLYELTKEYEKKYGPLSLSGESLDGYPWSWINSPWPWED